MLKKLLKTTFTTMCTIFLFKLQTAAINYEQIEENIEEHKEDIAGYLLIQNNGITIEKEITLNEEKFLFDKNITINYLNHLKEYNVSQMCYLNHMKDMMQYASNLYKYFNDDNIQHNDNNKQSLLSIIEFQKITLEIILQAFKKEYIMPYALEFLAEFDNNLNEQNVQYRFCKNANLHETIAKFYNSENLNSIFEKIIRNQNLDLDFFLFNQIALTSYICGPNNNVIANLGDEIANNITLLTFITQQYIENSARTNDLIKEFKSVLENLEPRNIISLKYLIPYHKIYDNNMTMFHITCCLKSNLLENAQQVKLRYNSAMLHKVFRLPNTFFSCNPVWKKLSKKFQFQYTNYNIIVRRRINNANNIWQNNVLNLRRMIYNNIRAIRRRQRLIPIAIEIINNNINLDFENNI